MERGKKALLSAARQGFHEKQQRLDMTLERMELLNPIRMLRRGYGVVENAKGRLVRSAGEMRAGDKLTVILADGRVHADVRKVERGGNG